MAQSFVRCDRHGNVVGNLLGVMSAVRDQSADSTSNAGYATSDKLTITLTGELDEGDRILWQDPKGKWWEWACKVPDAKRGDSIAVSTDVCVSSWEFDLAGKWVEEIKVATSGNGTTNVKTPAEVLALVLDGSAWSVGTVDGSEPVEFYGSDTSDYTSYYKTDALTCVHRLCKYFGLEAYPTVEVSGNSVTSRKVNLVKRRGSKDPVWRFSYSRDLQGVRRTFSGTPVYTKLHVFGKGDPIMNELNVFTGAYDKKITFADINGGKDYLEDDSLLANFGTLGPNGTTVHTEGRVDFDQCEDTALLLKWGREYFERQKTPEVSYELDVTATNKAGMGYGGCDIGDAVQVVDTSFPEDLRLSARVIELEEDLLGGAQTMKVTLGSAIRSITNTAASTAGDVADIQANIPAWNQSGGLFSDYLDKLRKQMNEEFIKNGNYHVSSFDYGDIWSSVEVDPDTGQPLAGTTGDKWAINIGSAGFRIANSLNSDGTWNWSTFGTGKGFVADYITSGTIDAAVVTIANLLKIGNDSTAHVEVRSDGAHIIDASGTERALFGETGRVGQTSGIHTVQDGDGFYVMNGDKVQSSFKRLEVNLGVNTASAKINLCGDNGRIEYEKDVGLSISTGERSSLTRYCALYISQKYGVGARPRATADASALHGLALGPMQFDAKPWQIALNMGSRVLSGDGGTSAVLFYSSEIAWNIGRMWDSSKCYVGAMNGDGSTSDAHVEGCTYLGGDIYAVFDRAVSGSIRVNWFSAVLI